MPLSAPNVLDQTATIGTAFSITLDPGTGGNAPLAYSITGLPTWLNFNPVTRVLSGTPTTEATHELTYVITDSDNDTVRDTLRVLVRPAPADILSSVRRLDSLDDLDTIFQRANTSTAEQGTWRYSSNESTPTRNTGPGGNSASKFVYSESSGSGEPSVITANSVLTVHPAIMAAWTGMGRTLRFRAVVAGAAWGDTGEGIEIQGRVSSADSWSRVELIEGWAYSSPTAGQTITDFAGDTLTIAQDGGWVDFSVAIPDDYTEVRMRSMPLPGTGDIFHHDAALWQVELRAGQSGTTLIVPDVPDQPATAGTEFSSELEPGIGGDAPLTYSVSGLPSWLSFDPTTRILSGTPTTEATHELTYVITDSDNDTVRDTLRVLVRPAPADILSSVRRLDSLDDLDTIFQRANTSMADGGTWRFARRESTPTGNTGPGGNSASKFVYSESSGSGEPSVITANSVLTVHSAIMAAWTGMGRALRFRAVIAGAAWGDTGEGIEIQGRVSSADSWSRVELIEGWAYSSPTAGQTITDFAGDTLTIAQDGGWVDFSVAIPDDYTEVRMRSMPLPGTGNIFHHDAALWQVELRAGEPDTTPNAPDVPDQTAVQGVAFSVTLDAGSGGNAPLTYAVNGRPAWLDFNANTRVLSGTPDATGAHDLTYVVRDNDGDEATDAFTVTVNEPDTTPNAPDVPDQTATQGVAFSVTLDAGSGGNAPLAYAVNGRPAWLAFNANTRVLSGTPDATGAHDLTYVVRDNDGDEATDAFTVTVNEPDTTPSAPDVPDQTAVQGVAFSVTLDAGSGGNAPLAYAVNGRPAWLDFNANTRVLSGTPDATGAHDLTYVVRDNDGDEATDAFRVTVNEPDTTPSAPDVPDQTATQGVAFSATLDPGTGGNAPLTYAVNGRPAWLAFNANTRVLSGTPDATGAHDLTYVVRDNDGDEATDAFTVTVNEPDTTPSAPDVPDQTAVQGVAFSVTLNAGSGGNAPLAYAVNRRPTWLNFNANTRVLSGTPDATGAHDLTYVVRDNDGDEATDAFTVTVNEPDTTPSAPDVPDQTAVQGVAFSVTLDAGSGGNAPLTYAVNGRPAWLDFNANTRVLSGTPDAIGPHDLTYVVRDNDGDEATDAFRVTVNEPDTTPTAPDVPDQTATQGVAFSATLDPSTGGNAPLTYAVSGRPAWLDFNANTRVLSGTPDATGAHDLTYVVRDNDGDEATDAFTVTVNEPDTTPSAPDVPDQTAVQGVAFSVTLDAGSGGNAPLAYAVNGRPAWLAFNANTRVLSGTPDATGAHDLTYVVRDNDGDEATDAFTVTVNEPDTTPSAPDVPDQTAVQGVAFSVTLNAGSGGNAPLAYAVNRRPTWLNFNANTRVLSGTPDATGAHDLTYVVRDNDGDEATDAFTVTVNEPDTTPSAPDVPDQTAVQGVAFSVTLDAGSGGNAPLTYAVNGRPAWLDFNANTRVLSGTPDAIGPHDLTYVVRDNDGDEATDAFRVTVNEPDTTPTAPDVPDQTATQGVAFSATLDPSTGGNAPLTYAVSGRPAWLDFNANTRVLSGTPDATGAHDLTYVVRDNDGDEATDAFTVTVNEPDTTPSAPDVPDQTAVQGVAFSVTLDAGSGGNAPLAYAVNGRPAWLDFNANTRVLSGTPDATGAHDLTYVVRDNDGDEATDAFTVTVNEPVTIPIAPDTPVLTDGRPAAPTRPEVEAVSETSLVATWTAPTEGDVTITSYNIRISVAGQDTWLESTGVTSPHTFADQEQGTNYEVQVRAVNSIGAGPWTLSGRAATHLILEATELKNDAERVYRTDWNSKIIYKTFNKGKVILGFHHTDTEAVILTVQTSKQIKGAGGELLDIEDSKYKSEIVEHRVRGPFDPEVYNDLKGRVRFTVAKITDDGMPITGVGIAIERYP